ncbi:atypical/HisK protein kinase [Coprinopsis cinerea okayama7|uniref:Atypical/HisK protein kinase n=1 Tax=Coprinopsis cinerea (strain Okayama-7 / 130 / ATCC MYA-4618 / FGSC 9003) TaxID=240176 RepID=D6RM33_COPC7|nr:atypical/HisK protein kinase [Coprinopsis cinerea okayama7\|eukprot:XP_002911425.1 atypical/HisK protein kinase [Coprinopsis cinerea okayama7\
MQAHCEPSVLNPVGKLHTNGLFVLNTAIANNRYQTSDSTGIDPRSLTQSINAAKRHTVSLPTSPYQEGSSRSYAEGTPLGQANGLATFSNEALLPRTSSSDDLEVPSDSNLLSTHGRSLSGDTECDWATFITAYANGRWDPHKPPNRPHPCHGYDSETGYMKKLEPVQLSTSLQVTASDFDQDRDGTSKLRDGRDKVSISLQAMQDQAGSIIASSTNGRKFHNLKMDFPLKLPVSGRSRISFPPSTSTASIGSNSSMASTAASNSDLQTTVATMRWAAARVDISPLALPSPEHELTDPMRGVITPVPGSHPPDDDEPHDQVITPGGSRRSRLSSFWEGTIDVDPKAFKMGSIPRKHSRLSLGGNSADGRVTPDSVQTNKQDIPDKVPKKTEHSPATQLSILAAQPPPATAPIPDKKTSSRSVEDSDYFGNFQQSPKPITAPILVEPVREVHSTSSNPAAADSGSRTVPALPRRICLTRQTSSPLPISLAPPEARIPGGRVPSDSANPNAKGRAVKEEQMFSELGYLAPPNPPDELERRRALYKFNIWYTGPDLNFDRIAHLAKLVFNTKGVIVSLIDGNEQGDEPMIVLDTHLDWRFARNPLVINSPRIRFYAGAPLRTQDGYNIGTLALIDDVSREDFSPRQRHTLKEFAAIAMREMELWRDKIQLRIRDRIQSSMEEFTRECLEIDSEVHPKVDKASIVIGTSMDRVYDRAAKLVQRTLDVEGVIVMDVTHCEVLETMGDEGNVSVTLHHGTPGSEMEKRPLSREDYQSLNNFFAAYPEGKISEGILPPSFRPYMPTHIRYALLVPIFNIDKRPFALLCAYNTNLHSKRFKGMSVIILSAVLKRRMILADKAKSLFISNISHELRTPLHGILAAAELLSDSPLNHSQMSFIQTVQACGTSLVETVNHVLDFTKLSGNVKAGGVENVIVPITNDMMQLIEEAIDGSWIGYKARTANLVDSGIGSVYSPPSDETTDQGHQPSQPHVETVIDIGYRREGWLLKYEKGGIRRVLMNLFGNSLKFTTDGYVHVRLRLLPRLPDDPPNKVRLELAIEDTGKGISQNFLKNQLFHPFSQENPLQTGTGLGLAIVNSIVSSENVGGKVDVRSEEGQGTEIKVFFPAEIPEDDPRLADAAQDMEHFRADKNSPLPKISMLGFESQHKGIQLLYRVLRTYITEWWGLDIVDDSQDSDIVVLNEDLGPIRSAIERNDIRRPFVILWVTRGNPTVLAAATEYERIGGFCRILYKPTGPSKLRGVLKLCMHSIKINRYYRDSAPMTAVRKNTVSGFAEDKDVSHGGVLRRNSDENSTYASKSLSRPPMSPRSATIHPSVSSLRHQLLLSALPEKDRGQEGEVGSPVSDGTGLRPMVSIGPGGSVLKSSVQPTDIRGRKLRVLVIEDNNILRNLLAKWLIKKGYDFEEAVDGQAGVTAFQEHGPFDVALIDLSMPVLDGVAATKEIRRIESSKAGGDDSYPSVKILALTGMSSLEDKRRAFEAGVDGYLVKPVAFKTLDEMFHKLGISS